MEYSIVEGEVTLIDDYGNPLATISGANGSKLGVATDLDDIIDDGALSVREQNLDSEGCVRNSSHNMAYQDGSWQPFNLDDEGRLRVITEVVAEPHTISGTAHIGVLTNNQIPSNIVRNYKLVTTSGVLRYDIEHIDGGSFI